MKKSLSILVTISVLFLLTGKASAGLNDGLVAYYPFDGDPNDYSEKGNHGIEYGDIRYIDGVIDQGKYFDIGVPYDYVQIPNILNNTEYSVSLWMSAKNISNHNSFLSLNSGSDYSSSDFWLFTSHDRIAVYQAKVDLRGYNDIFYNSKQLDSDTLYFIVCVYKNNTLTIYLNSKIYAEYQNISDIPDNPSDLKIGSGPRFYGSNYQHDGLIDEFRIYNRALSESEIHDLYDNHLCEGDFDSDGDVDGSDLTVFAAEFDRTDCCESDLPPCIGDFDGDCDVDGSDLAVFGADFGRTDCPGPQQQNL